MFAAVAFVQARLQEQFDFYIVIMYKAQACHMTCLILFMPAEFYPMGNSDDAIESAYAADVRITARFQSRKSGLPFSGVCLPQIRC